MGDHLSSLSHGPPPAPPGSGTIGPGLAAAPAGAALSGHKVVGYEITMVKDATASYSDQDMHAALAINIPNCASSIVSMEEIVASISAL